MKLLAFFAATILLLFSCDTGMIIDNSTANPLANDSPSSQDSNTNVNNDTVVNSRSVLISDCDTGAPLSNATITVEKSGETVARITTDESGIATFPENLSFSDGDYNFIVERNGYVQTTDKITIQDGDIVEGNRISIPKTSSGNCIKIVMDWGATPSDLDSHLAAGSFHVYFSSKSQDNANLTLDHDDTTSYGPETITIKNVNSALTYNYYVHNYSAGSNTTSTALSASKARVRLYINNEYKQTWTVPVGQSGVYWKVFKITGGSTVVSVNEVKTSQPSSSDSSTLTAVPASNK
ncbi:MAG: carboxypeptidase regulatory-like domain-containing protein [Spirochaetaceae bacterium]|nr:carboxypeptidase regulatory-like domain-containing protein [Spirochaetaceae bacterium]